MAQEKLPPQDEKCNEDYTGSVCWLLWNKSNQAYDTREALIDVGDFAAVCHHTWRIQTVGKCRMDRVMRSGKSGNIYLARQLMGFPDGLTVDHINRNTLDDRSKNLRATTISENNFNSAARRPAVPNQAEGVIWCRATDKWLAIGEGGRHGVYIGAFDTQEEAVKAYRAYLSG